MGRGPRAGSSGPLRSALRLGHRFPSIVVLGWVLAAAALSLLVTPLGTVVERSSTALASIARNEYSNECEAAINEQIKWMNLVYFCFDSFDFKSLCLEL